MMLGVDQDETGSIDLLYSYIKYSYYSNNLVGYEIIKYWPQSQNAALQSMNG